MMELTRESSPRGPVQIAAQPIVLAGATLLIIIIAVGSIGVWRASSGASPELDRTLATRQLQVRATQASEELVEKTRGLEVTQQESIDQLQMVQDQLQLMRKQLAAQQTDSKRLSEQITALTEAISGLRESFASAQSSEPSSTAPSGHRTLRARASRSSGKSPD
jgi:hypothetical protein